MAISCAGAFTQGGIALCRTMPNAAIYLDGAESGAADADGWVVVGFTREHGPTAQIQARAGGESATQSVDIAPREFDIQRVDGLPQQTVTPTDPAVLARIQREAVLKQAGFQSTANIEGFLDGFILPVEGGRVSGTWGNQRVLNGTPSTPHFGYDIAAPTGTPIRAPAAGVVTLAESDMHYEGGLVFIDHGQGLITMYLHMSRLDVHAGDTVEQGQVIGAVGSSGRATGPHLCWRMKLRNTQQLDPSVAIAGLAEARRELLSAN
ncbi:peptidase M24 [Candidatus Viadribacter manganicus]|uniref:Peptidase M24 n=2 Tax=Candidatus Viadribacter manganicus TaxID=1759059 RepID=A0A1B1AMZ6_9PROT|nr:peptidase M24 [Candidatus Viadribacter manganicus]